MQTRSSDENSVCLSVRPSVRLSNACIVTKRKKAMFRFLYHTKDDLAYFSAKKNGWWGRPLLPEILGRPAPVGAKSPILNRYSLVAPQPQHLAKKSSINTNRKSPTLFPMSLRWPSYAAPKPRKKGSKPQNCRFPSKIALRLKKVCHKLYLCENCQQQSCKAFIGLMNHAKMIGGGRPLLPEMLG